MRSWPVFWTEFYSLAIYGTIIPEKQPIRAARPIYNLVLIPKMQTGVFFSIVTFMGVLTAVHDNT
jgi:hypothetical protein